MQIDDLKIWFWDKYNSCYSIKYNNKIYMMYDPNFIRAKKLANILNKEIGYPTEVNGVCLFQLDYKNSDINIDYMEVWSFFEKNYSNNYIEIRTLIESWLREYDNLKNLTPLLIPEKFQINLTPSSISNYDFIKNNSICK